MNELFLSGTILTLVKTPTTGDTSHVGTATVNSR